MNTLTETTIERHQHCSPIIVYGAPRSGTGYVASILNQHPEVFISPEARLFIWLDQALNGITRNDDALLGVREEFVEHLRASLPKLIRDFYWEMKPTRYWGDKNPHYATPTNRRGLVTIAGLFPRARFIHIVRDGRDVVTSLLRRGWADFVTAHQIWTNHVTSGREFGLSQGQGVYYELRYEDLVAEDTRAAQSLFDFLEIPIDEKVLHFCKSQRAERTPISEPTRDLQRGAIVSDWAAYFAPQDRLRSLELLSALLIELSYENADTFQDLYVKAAECNAETLADVRRYIPPKDSTVAVISKGDDRLLSIPVQRALHFPADKQGVYLGHHPRDSEEAIAYLSQAMSHGAEYLLVPSESLWWLEHYKEFRQHLDDCHQRVSSDHQRVFYRLNPKNGQEVERLIKRAIPPVRSTPEQQADNTPRSRLSALLGSKPQLHWWGGKSQDGGLSTKMLRRLFAMARGGLDTRCLTVLETGAGLSTLAFLLADPERLITIAPNQDLHDRIVAEADRLTISRKAHEFYVDRSEMILPQLTASKPAFIDFALIDGGHGLPTVFVDFCFINAGLKKGGYLAIDDTQLYSVKQLYMLLREQPQFELVQQIGKLAILKKNTSDPFLPDHAGQPFVLRNSPGFTSDNLSRTGA